MFKKYWKEITLAFLINLVLTYLIQLVPAYELNTTTMVLAILAILTPLIAAIPAGYLIGKKTKNSIIISSNRSYNSSYSFITNNFLFSYDND